MPLIVVPAGMLKPKLVTNRLSELCPGTIEDVVLKPLIATLLGFTQGPPPTALLVPVPQLFGPCDEGLPGVAVPCVPVPAVFAVEPPLAEVVIPQLRIAFEPPSHALGWSVELLKEMYREFPTENIHEPNGFDCEPFVNRLVLAPGVRVQTALGLSTINVIASALF